MSKKNGMSEKTHLEQKINETADKLIFLLVRRETLSGKIILGMKVNIEYDSDDSSISVNASCKAIDLMDLSDE